MNTIPADEKKEERRRKYVTISSFLLESFGNAKTTLNWNSSRSGEYQKVFFDGDKFVGVERSRLLFDRERVVAVPHGERTFHAFYYIFHSEFKNEWMLTTCSNYGLLSKSGCMSISQINDEEKYTELKMVMKSLGLNAKYQKYIFKLLAAILHLSNIEFEEADTQSSHEAQVSTGEVLEIVASLLGVEVFNLDTCLTQRTRKVGNELCTQFLDVNQAEKARDCIAKSIYHRLFDWLNEYCNSRTNGGESTNSFVGLLDVPGFENERHNQIHQLYVNYSNENFHNLFLKTMDESQPEVNLEPRGDMLRLFLEPKTGLFDILNLESNSEFSSESGSVRMISRFHKENSLFKQINAHNFRLSHFMSPVVYDYTNMAEQNLQEFSDVSILVNGSGNVKKTLNRFLAGLFARDSKGTLGQDCNESHDQLVKTFASTTNSFVVCVNSNRNMTQMNFDSKFVLQQLNAHDLLRVSNIIQNGYMWNGTIGEFIQKYSVIFQQNDLLSDAATDLDLCLSLFSKLDIDKHDFLINESRILLRRNAWNLLNEEMMQFPVEMRTKKYTDFTLQPRTLSKLGIFNASQSSLNFDFDDALSEAPTELSGFTNFTATEGIPLEPLNQKKEEKEVKEPEAITGQRRLWLFLVKIFTFWIPTAALRMNGMRAPEVQLAWREKVTLCILIVLLQAFMLFYIIGFTNLICPPQKVLNRVELANKSYLTPNVIVKGRIYDFTQFADSHHTGTAEPSFIYEMAGLDASKMFPLKFCQLEVDPPPTDCKVEGRTRSFTTCPHLEEYMYRELLNGGWYVGDLGWTYDEVRQGKTPDNALIVIKGKVYNVSALVEDNNLKPKGKKAVMEAPWGVDKSEYFDYEGVEADLRCLQDYMVGSIDRRTGANCRAADYILIGSTALVVGVMIFKFLAALQLGSRREPEDLEKFVILQVPCYTENEESLRKTIDSLAVLDYDDKRKLLFIVADGMIIGSGNDRPTPRIVLDILGVDPDLDPEALSFISLGEGNKQHNMGKVYSGLYQCAGHRVPFVVVAKVGTPSERSRAGNRGKRDSQMILMKFLNKVHFESPMNPMELEIFHQIKNVIGVDPSFYEYILMVDADTEVVSDSLNRMISCMIHDSKIMGICGETEISNEKDSWATMIQVYEYFISHHLAKAFESLFGSVTCLPGCFCMYRIRTPVKHSPLIISPEIIENYSENKVDTLHKKNLLALGEDRYLTTLMMKYFPQHRLKFTPDARCKTVAPERWSVLLSQRRRWINSTIHNLFELVMLPQLCGFCCFSMRFVVFLDLFATLVMPATVAYLVYLIYSSIQNNTAPIISLILIGVAYGMQVLIFILKRQWQHIGWMIIYILAIPIFNFFIPVYSFWHFDDFSWGNTRRVMNEKQKALGTDEPEFDPESMPHKTWADYERETFREGQEYSHLVQNPSERTALSSKTLQKPFLRSDSRVTLGSEVSLDRLRERTQSYNSMTNLLESRSTHDLPRFSNYTPYDGPSVRQTAVFNQTELTDEYPTPEEIVEEIKYILSTANLMKVSKKNIRETLSEFFQVDLTPFREFINESIDAILQGQQ